MEPPGTPPPVSTVKTAGDDHAVTPARRQFDQVATPATQDRVHNLTKVMDAALAEIADNKGREAYLKTVFGHVVHTATQMECLDPLLEYLPDHIPAASVSKARLLSVIRAPTPDVDMRDAAEQIPDDLAAQPTEAADDDETVVVRKTTGHKRKAAKHKKAEASDSKSGASKSTRAARVPPKQALAKIRFAISPQLTVRRLETCREQFMGALQQNPTFDDQRGHRITEFIFGSLLGFDAAVRLLATTRQYHDRSGKDGTSGVPGGAAAAGDNDNLPEPIRALCRAYSRVVRTEIQKDQDLDRFMNLWDYREFAKKHARLTMLIERRDPDTITWLGQYIDVNEDGKIPKHKRYSSYLNRALEQEAGITVNQMKHRLSSGKLVLAVTDALGIGTLLLMPKSTTTELSAISIGPLKIALRLLQNIMGDELMDVGDMITRRLARPMRQGRAINAPTGGFPTTNKIKSTNLMDQVELIAPPDEEEDSSSYESEESVDADGEEDEE